MSAVVLASASCSPPREPADLLVRARLVRTSDPARPEATVLVVRDGRVAAVGGEELAARHAPARVLDLGERVVVPGLIDAHAHFLGLGQQAEQLELRHCRSFEEVVERVRAALAAAQPGEFVLGRGWNQELWPDERFPTHEALSAVSPDNPVLLRRVDGHATLANAKAMALAGLGRDTVSPAGGEILRGDDGAPTGVFVDAAADLLPRPPAAEPSTLERRALAAQERCLAVGLTGVHDAGVDARGLAVLERLAAEGRLKVRLNVMLEADFDEAGVPAPWLAERLAKGPRRGDFGGRLTVTAVKIYLDGALGSRGAALLAPYADAPESSGLLMMSRDRSRAIVARCRDAGFQAACHAIGDAANRLALDVYAEVLGDEAATSDHRFRVEHAQVISEADLPRFAKLGVVASVQPTHATSDMNMAEERVGRERLRGAYAWRSLAASGARLALGSDFPVEDENPFWGLHAAATRQDREGRPPGGWIPEEALSREEALRGFTLDAAWAGFDEERAGSLSPGKAADFLVLEDDPLTCGPERLHALRPLETWIDGERVWPR